ncbi:hypothetical protein D4R20_00675 [bacterium]|nr:MAG: hypothetical protein D4R20_00675 [bacterium]
MNPEAIVKLEEVLNEKAAASGNNFSFKIKNLKCKSLISVDIIIESNLASLISVYTDNTHLQLQSCNGFV